MRAQGGFDHQFSKLVLTGYECMTRREMCANHVQRRGTNPIRSSLLAEKAEKAAYFLLCRLLRRTSLGSSLATALAFLPSSALEIRSLWLEYDLAVRSDMFN